jgi:hypothetical protein
VTEPIDLPPPPPPAGDEADASDEAQVEWALQVEAAIASVAETIGAAIEEHESGTIDLAELQRRCLDAGAVRVGDTLLLWDWVAGKVFAYDGFHVVEVTEPEP